MPVAYETRALRVQTALVEPGHKQWTACGEQATRSLAVRTAVLPSQGHESAPLAITTVVQELLNFGRSRLEAMRICRRGRSPRMMGQ